MTNDIIDALVKEATAQLPWDEAKIGQVFDHMMPKVRTMVRGRVFSSDDVEDVAQTVFMRAYQYLGQFRFQSSFRSWLYRIADNEIRTFNKRAAQRKTEELDEGQEFSLPERPRRDATDRLDVEATIARLRPRHAEVLRLFYFNHYSVEEASAILGIGKSALKMRLSRARDEFAALYGGTGSTVRSVG